MVGYGSVIELSSLPPITSCIPLKYFFRKTYKIDQTYRLLGNYQRINLTNAEKELFINAAYNPLPTELTYNSLILMCCSIFKVKKSMTTSPAY